MFKKYKTLEDKLLIFCQENLQRITCKIVSKFFPANRLQEVRILSGGVFNVSYLLILQKDLKVVLRVAPSQKFLVGYQHNLMQAEYLAYEFCRKYKVPSPNVYTIDDSFEITDRIYMLSEYIPSIPLNKVYLPMDTLLHCYREAGEAVRKMHSILGSRFGRLAIQLENGGFDTWSEAILYEVNMWLQIFSYLKILPQKVIEAIRNVFEDHVDILNKVISPHLAHGDLWNGNLLIFLHNKNYLFRAIIDVDHAIFGDPEIDFFCGKMLNDSFVQGYGKDLDTNWEAFIRRRLYLLLFTIRQCYVYKYVHCDLTSGNEQIKHIYHFLSEFNKKF